MGQGCSALPQGVKGNYWFVGSRVGRGDHRLLGRSGWQSRQRRFEIEDWFAEGCGEGLGDVGSVGWCGAVLIIYCDAFGASPDDMLFLVDSNGSGVCASAFECFLGIVGLLGIWYLTGIEWGGKIIQIVEYVSVVLILYRRPAEVGSLKQPQFAVPTLNWLF